MNPKRPPYYDFLYISPGNLIDLEVRRCQACEGQIFNYGLASDLLSSKCAAPRFTGITTPRQAWYMLEGFRDADLGQTSGEMMAETGHRTKEGYRYII